MADLDDIVLKIERCDGDGDAAANTAVVVASNAAFRGASGYSDDHLLGRPAADLFPNREQAEILMKAIRDNGSLRSELLCSQANGATFMMGMHLMPAPARAPGKACFVILGRDITAAFQARQMQDAIQHLLAKVFSSVDAAVADRQRRGAHRHDQPRVRSAAGLCAERHGGPALDRDRGPDARARIAAIVKQQTADEHDISYSSTALRADGSELKVTSDPP